METVNVEYAIKRQVPKKPKKVKIENGDVTHAECPRCGYSFPDIGGVLECYGTVEKYDYCPNCGQRIDWGKVK